MPGMTDAPYDDAGPTLSSSRWGTSVRLTFASPRHPYDDDDMIEYLVKVEGTGVDCRVTRSEPGGRRRPRGVP